jgi:hypothetical protein
MTQYLRIQNPGVAPSEAFTVFGLCMKKYSDNPRMIGMFGSGSKHGVAVCLRHRVSPIIFAGNLKMEFSTRQQKVSNGLRSTDSERVVVKYGGKDETGASRTATEDLGFDVTYGTHDWVDLSFALREFVSNALDRSEEEADHAFWKKWALENDRAWYVEENDFETIQNCCPDEVIAAFRKTSRPWNNVEVDIVAENQVRAKTGYTRIFVPLNDDVRSFYCNLGKWFLHFSEPHLLETSILPKADRNMDKSKNAVIYRRGVRVREFSFSNNESLFDYNLPNLTLDESRNATDWDVQYQAAREMANAPASVAQEVVRSFMTDKIYWEHRFSSYALEDTSMSTAQKQIWREAVMTTAPNAVIANSSNEELAKRKGYTPIVVPENFSKAFRSYEAPTVETVISHDERNGRELLPVTAQAQAAVDYVWNLIVDMKMTNGKSKPKVQTFRKIMDAGSQILGFYRDEVVYLNQDIAGEGGGDNLSHQLLVTALEEVVHHVTQSTDCSRDMQDFVLNLAIHLAKK